MPLYKVVWEQTVKAMEYFDTETVDEALQQAREFQKAGRIIDAEEYDESDTVLTKVLEVAEAGEDYDESKDKIVWSVE